MENPKGRISSLGPRISLRNSRVTHVLDLSRVDAEDECRGQIHNPNREPWSQRMNLPAARRSPVLVDHERRRHVRYGVRVEVEIHREGSYDDMRLETTDLGRDPVSRFRRSGRAGP